MKCAVAIVLALIGMVVANPVAPLSYGYVSPVLLPSAVSVSSSIVNHGVTIPKIAVAAPIIRHVAVAAPIIKTAPIISAPVVTAPLGWGAGWGGLGYGWGGLGYGAGWGGLGWGKGWH